MSVELLWIDDTDGSDWEIGLARGRDCCDDHTNPDAWYVTSGHHIPTDDFVAVLETMADTNIVDIDDVDRHITAFLNTRRGTGATP